jgi:hypothetical protein
VAPGNFRRKRLDFEMTPSHRAPPSWRSCVVVHGPDALPVPGGLKRENLERSEPMRGLFRSKNFLSRLWQCRQHMKFGSHRRISAAKAVPGELAAMPAIDATSFKPCDLCLKTVRALAHLVPASSMKKQSGTFPTGKRLVAADGSDPPADGPLNLGRALTPEGSVAIARLP